MFSLFHLLLPTLFSQLLSVDWTGDISEFLKCQSNSSYIDLTSRPIVPNKLPPCVDTCQISPGYSVAANNYCSRSIFSTQYETNLFFTFFWSCTTLFDQLTPGCEFHADNTADYELLIQIKVAHYLQINLNNVHCGLRLVSSSFQETYGPLTYLETQRKNEVRTLRRRKLKDAESGDQKKLDRKSTSKATGTGRSTLRKLAVTVNENEPWKIYSSCRVDTNRLTSDDTVMRHVYFLPDLHTGFIQYFYKLQEPFII